MFKIILSIANLLGLVCLTIFAFWWSDIDSRLINNADVNGWDTTLLFPNQILMTPLLFTGVSLLYLVFIVDILFLFRNICSKHPLTGRHHPHSSHQPHHG